LSKAKNYLMTNNSMNKLEFSTAHMFFSCLFSDPKITEKYSNLPSGIFYENDDKIIFEGMKHLYKEYRTFDLDTMKHYLKVTQFDNISNTLELVYFNGTIASNHVMYINTQYDHAKKFYLKKLAQDMEMQLEMGESDEVLKDLKEKIEKLESWKQQEGLPSVTSSFSWLYEKMCNEKDNEHTPKTETGYKALDGHIGSLMPGQMHVIAARPRKGKSMFALNIAVNVARKGFRVLYFSMEMSEQQTMTRYLQVVHNINGDKFKKVTDKFLEELGSLTPPNENVIFCYKSGLTAEDLESFLIKEKEHGDIDLVIIDHMHIMRGSGKEMTQQYTEVSRGIKRVAMNQTVPIITLAQMNRETEKRGGGEPKLSDLAQSGAIEQDAETVLFLDRDEDPDANPNELKLLGRKNRNGVGFFNLNYVVDFSTYRIKEI